MIEKPDIVDTIANEGIRLTPVSGEKYYKGLCPFHAEKTPSFVVYPQSQRFYCFGCGAKGDVIDFIMKLRSFNFKEALSYLNIRPAQTAKSSQLTKKKKLLQQFQKWRDDRIELLFLVLRGLKLLKKRVQSIEEAKNLADLYHTEPIWVHQLDILLHGDEREQFELYREVQYGKKI
jgi:DNA primase